MAQPASDSSSRDPWVWFDVDDVLVDTSAQLELSLRALTGRHAPVHTWRNHMFSENYGISPERRDEMRAAWIADQVLERSALFDGVPEAFALTRAKGYRVGLITARAWHPQAREITEAMSLDHGLGAERVILLNYADSKAGLLDESGTSVADFLDDTPRHVQGVVDRGWAGCLVTRPWNLDSGLRRVDSALDFARALPEAGTSPGARRKAAP